MLPAKSLAELHNQRAKLASSYNELLDEFSSKDLRNVGNYTISHLIGKGSFGKAYLASHKLINGSKVVLKSADKQDSNLAREIHHHRQFIHPHIARLYEVIVTENLVWLVLEYCPGNELYHYLTQNGPLAPTMVQKIFTQLVGAVSYVHQKSCVHRDLKLENILLDKNENVKLCDFGFTREYEGRSSYLQTWCGTVCYSAPEMLRGEKYAGEKVDVWSLGIILYALLCGELPFDEDDDDATKMKILKQEPKYPDTLPTAAKDLILLMLSKRPLLRPALSDILLNPWLADWAPQQQAILKIQPPAPFTTDLETDTLQRMKSAGVNIDAVIENVLSQRCDALAGWWILLLEKEERKERRRQRRRKEREAEGKGSKRMSTTSSRLLAVAIKESDEEKNHQDPTTNGEPPHSPHLSVQPTPTTPTLRVSPDSLTDPSRTFPIAPPRAIESRQSTSSVAMKRRSQLGPGIPPNRNSVLQVLASEPGLVNSEPTPQKRKRRYQPMFFSQLAHIKHWFKDPTKKSKSSNTDTAALANLNGTRPGDMSRVLSDQGNKRPSMGDQRPDLQTRNTHPTHRSSTHASQTSAPRLSTQSPAPLTPKSSYRRSNLRGRKSTSSSVSSIRSMQRHHPSHSKASSVSSASIGSPSTPSGAGLHAGHRRSSPSTVIRVHPTMAGPSPAGAGSVRPLRIPSKLNVPDAGPNSNNSTPFTGFGPPSPGLVFTKRKRSVFKGPMLGSGLGTRRRSDGSGLGVVASNEHDELAQNVMQTKNSGGMIREEDEEEIDDEEVEEVEAFTPVAEGERAYLIDESGETEFYHRNATTNLTVQPMPLTKWEIDS